MVELSRTKLSYISMKRCNAQILWLGERIPNYCPECGKPSIYFLHGGVERKGKKVVNWETLLEKNVVINIEE